MNDRSRDDTQSVEAELAFLQAEMDRLRMQAKAVKLRAEVERLQAEIGATPPPPATPPATVPSVAAAHSAVQDTSATTIVRKSVAPPTVSAPRTTDRSAPAESPAATVPPKHSTKPHVELTSAQPVHSDPSDRKNQLSPNSTREVPTDAAKAPVTDNPLNARPSPAKPPIGTSPVAPPDLDFEPSFIGKLWHSMGAFTISMVTHTMVLVALGFWTVPAIMELARTETLQVDLERNQEDLTQILPEETTNVGTEFRVTGSGSSAAAIAGAAGFGTGLPSGHGTSLQGGSGPGSMQGTLAEAGGGTGGTGIGFNDVGLWGVSGSDMGKYVGAGAPGDPSQVVDTYAEAMDRITNEILLALLKNDVLVMWCFDQSESMKDDQQEIRERVDRVYQELGITPAAKGDHLLTAVGSYGKDFMLHTKKPTSKLSEIRAAIDLVPVDPSGKENQCPAVGLMINHHRKFATQGHRQLLLILVTDESGEQEDNEKNLEIAIDEAKAAHCPIYVLGRESVFGYPYAFMNYVEPSTQLNFWIQINRGPETPYPEQLQTNGFYRRYDAHASGFGPYEQTRMARETGGVFFLLPSPEVNLVARDDRKYELEAMKPYLPDLSPRKVYAHERDKSELRSTLWKVITDLNPYNPIVQPHIELRHSFSIRPEDFYQQYNEEHAKAVQYFVYLNRCEKELERIKKFRDKESSVRWRANYDLLFAQVLAYKVRLYEYGAYLEAFAKKPKQIKNPLGPLRKTTHWELAHRAETLTGDLTKSYIERSKKMFENVIKDHSGTPWAARAQWELSRGFGVELVEAYDDPRRVSLSTKLPNY